MSRKLPAFQFYPGDWMKDPALRVCSHTTKGVYIDMLCLMFECEQRGVLATGNNPWSDEQVAAAIGGPKDATLSCIAELLAMGVVSRNQAGAIFSRRMVRDEENRRKLAENGAKGGRPKNQTKTKPKTKSKPKQNHFHAEDENEVEGESEGLFEVFWEAYPSVRKGSKAKAREAWAKATRKALPEAIIAAAREYAASPVGQGEYSKMPSTWLNGECWCDDRRSWHRSGKGDSDPRGNVARMNRILHELEATDGNGHG